MCKTYSVRTLESLQDLCRNEWVKFKITSFQIVKEATINN